MSSRDNTFSLVNRLRMCVSTVWGTRRAGGDLDQVEMLDQDGQEPDDRPPALVNELQLTRLPDGGGKVRGRFDDAAMFDAIATVIDAHARPLTGDDDRSMAERQAEALADVCGYVLDHGPTNLVPECGGHRPHVNVLIRLEDLEGRARAACLDFGGPVAVESLRMLCCDARVVPIVLNGRASRSTSAAPPAPFRTGCAARWPPGIAGVRILGVADRFPGPNVTTFCRGSAAVRRSSTTW
jgi:Domain of unknown function (DUF222)